MLKLAWQIRGLDTVPQDLESLRGKEMVFSLKYLTY